MTIKRLRPPLEGSAYNGFAAAPGPEPAEAEGEGAESPRERPPVPNYPIDRFDRRRRPRRAWLRSVILAFGVVVAMGLAVLLVLWSRESPRPPGAAAPALASGTAPVPAPPSSARAEQALVAARETPATARVFAAEPAPVAETRAAPTPASPRLRGEKSSSPEPQGRCDRAREPITRLICRDPEVAGLDRQLNQAFAGAVRSGAPAGPLAEQQEAWVIRRDHAAQASPGSVADLYRARIAELNQAAPGR